MRRSSVDKAFGASLVAPAVLVLCATIVYPLARIVGMSFQDYSLLAPAERAWNDFANYRATLGDREFPRSFIRTIVYVAATVSVQFALGLAMALLFNRNGSSRAGKALRGAVFLPWTVPTLVSALLWMWLLQQQYGLVNYLLKSLGIISESVNWLGGKGRAMGSVVAASVWRQTPLMMVMLFAGLRTVPRELEEAAIVDGVGPLGRFLHVTLPCIMSVVKTVVLTAVIVNFQMFVLFYTMTVGGPGRDTTTLSVYTYETAFLQFDFGKGAAIGVFWLSFLVLFSVLYNRSLRGREAFAE